MSGWRSKKLMHNDQQGTAMSIDGLTIEQAELLEAIYGFKDEEFMREWQSMLTPRQSKIVDSLIITILLEHFDRIIDMDSDYELANEYLSKFRLQ